MAEDGTGGFVSRRDVAGIFGTGGAVVGLASTMQTRGAKSPPNVGCFHARDHGIIGDASIDETAQVQAFLDRCDAAGGGVAYFGTMRVRIGGPLVSTVGIVFDPIGYGEGEAPGFYVTGSGYTALTVVGGIADFNVTVAGYGDAHHGADGAIVRDTRPRVNGIAFGTPDEQRPLAASVVRHARAFKLAGFGVLHTTCYDCTFMAISVEQCGTEAQYAFEVMGSAKFNCSESVWVRLQVESAACRAISIHPNTLSCAFGKVHSERATARRGDPVWALGGACSYDAIRLHANNPALARARVVGQQTMLTNLRVDNHTEVPVEIDATNGSVILQNPVATLAPLADQNGRVTVIGGMVNALRIGAGWSFYGVAIARLDIGFMGTGGQATFSQCVIDRLAPQKGQTTGVACFHGSEIRSASFVASDGRMARVELLGGTRCVNPRLSMAYQTVLVDGSSTITGDVSLDHCALRLLGTIEGALAVVAAPQSLAGMDAVVTGTVTGWTYPQASDVLGPYRQGMFCKNLGHSGVSPVVGWTYSGQRWVATG